MLVLKRKDGQWINITHAKTGEVVRMHIYNLKNGQVDIAFDDASRNFDIQRPDRKQGPKVGAPSLLI
jgi:sRNA-binding carbon storage regulator CsrA